MRTMLVSDLVILKSSLAPSLAMFFVVGVAMAIGTGTPVSAAAGVAAMMVLLTAITLSSYDEMSGWQGFRAALPVSRRDIVLGRYAAVLVAAFAATLFALAASFAVTAAASVLPLPENMFAGLVWEGLGIRTQVGAAALGTMVSLWGVMLMLPLVARFGLTKAARYIPVVFILLAVFGVMALEDHLFGSDAIVAFVAWCDANPDVALAFVLLIAAAFTMLLIAISAFIAVKLYEKREL